MTPIPKPLLSHLFYLLLWSESRCLLPGGGMTFPRWQRSQSSSSSLKTWLLIMYVMLQSSCWAKTPSWRTLTALQNPDSTRLLFIQHFTPWSVYGQRIIVMFYCYCSSFRGLLHLIRFIYFKWTLVCLPDWFSSLKQALKLSNQEKLDPFNMSLQQTYYDGITA